MPSKYRAESQTCAKTFQLKPAEIKRRFFLVDAENKNLGRLAVEIAKILMGKRSVSYTQNQSMGDNVIVLNADKVFWTGKNKGLKRKYRRHSGYPGGLKETSLSQMFSQKPEELFYTVVKGMLPKNKLRDPRLKRLKVYSGKAHPHQGQEKELIKIETLPGV